MKKIIDGKVYNTETAKCLGLWDNGYYGRDFRRCWQELYITKKGQYFLAGAGGAMSYYATPCGDCTTDGSGIELLTKKEAMAWAEERLTADEYTEIFGNEIEEG